MTNSRDKGHRFERLVAKALTPFVPDARRGNQAHNPRECDVEGSPFFRIECKHHKQISWAKIRDWCDKAVQDGLKYKDNRIPIIIAKRDRELPLFFGPMSSLMRVHEILYGDQREDAEVHEL